MSKHSLVLDRALTHVLAGTDFRRKQNTWRRYADEVVQVLNLQKSRFGQQYYLNFGVWLRVLEEAKEPKEEQCHIRIRADEVAREGAGLPRLLDLDTEVPDRERRICECVSADVLPFAEQCCSIEGLRDLYKAGAFKRAMLTAATRALLEA